MLFAAAIDQSVSPGWTVWGTEAPAGEHAARAASAPSAPMRVGFRIASCLWVLLAPPRSGRVSPVLHDARCYGPPQGALRRASLGSGGMRLLPLLLAAAAVAGCGKEFNTDTAGF